MRRSISESFWQPARAIPAACMLTGVPFDRNADLEGLKTESLTQKDLKTMKAFRKLRTGDYGYLVLADRLLREYRD